MTYDPSEASDALAAIHDARRRAAAMPRMGWGYHSGFGVMLGALVYQQGMPIGTGRAAVLVAMIALGAILYRWKRSATGRWINGYRAGRTRLVGLAIAAVTLTLMVLSPPIHTILQSWQAGLIAFVAALLGGRLWYVAYDADLRAAS